MIILKSAFLGVYLQSPSPIMSTPPQTHAMPNYQRYKVVVVGDARVGKTQFIRRLLNCEFSDKYVRTLGVNVSPIVFKTNYGTIIFDVWDIAGHQDPYKSKGYYTGAKCAIAMINPSMPTPYQENEAKWTTAIKTMAGDIPIESWVSKSDLQALPCRGEMSAKTNVETKTPFLNLAKQLTGHEDLKFL